MLFLLPSSDFRVPRFFAEQMSGIATRVTLVASEVRHELQDLVASLKRLRVELERRCVVIRSTNSVTGSTFEASSVLCCKVPTPFWPGFESSGGPEALVYW